MIDRTSLHVIWIHPFAQCGCDALHNYRRDVTYLTRGGTVNMAAETGNDSPGVLQSLLQCRHYLCSFEVECIRPHRNLKRRMVHENRDRLGSLGLDQIDQMADPLRAKVTLLLPELKVSNAISLTG